ncbi:hypothetical protein TNCV_4414511 [Trichonephila clavipes]|uniref:Uncharacterized protein n=1 Tax=Trichonephila clavipes TaxID=2585209 RepID=A0A8X6S3Z6_TRICX|nr:hypothetical protein TNCV_4414511 [Trichonephila clavipes]
MAQQPMKDKAYTVPISVYVTMGAEVHKQMSRSGGQPKANPPVFRPQASLILEPGQNVTTERYQARFIQQVMMWKGRRQPLMCQKSDDDPAHPDTVKRNSSPSDGDLCHLIITYSDRCSNI